MHGCCYVRTSRRVSEFQLFVFIIFLFLVSRMFRLSALSATSGYNMLFASKLEPHQADILIGDRKPLDVILRLVEDVPEVILGVTDAILFWSFMVYDFEHKPELQHGCSGSAAWKLSVPECFSRHSCKRPGFSEGPCSASAKKVRGQTKRNGIVAYVCPFCLQLNPEPEMVWKRFPKGCRQCQLAVNSHFFQGDICAALCHSD